MPKLRKAVFPSNGQGIFYYTVKKRSEFIIYITPDKQKIKGDDSGNGGPSIEEDVCKHFTTPNYISLTVEENFVKFSLQLKATGERIILEHKKKPGIGVEPWEFATYWFSFDRDMMILKYGKGHTMEQTTFMTYDFLEGKTEDERKEIRKKYQIFFSPYEKKYVVVDSVCAESVNGDGGLIKAQQMLRFSPYPLVSNYPYLVKDSSEVSLFDLDRDQYMFSSSLPQACKELYDNIKGLTLEYPPDPIIKLTDAIRYSIETKGKTLYEKLKSKPDGFRYLRVTLGPDQRTAPGIPYVLEIWPKGNGSPIHNHGGACAIIKNLYGLISVNIYNKFTQPPEEKKMKPVIHFDLKENEMTWIDPNWYQTHKLHNNTDDFCATIQCYRYDYMDSIQWPNFDYITYIEGKEKYELEEFYPDSDFTFINLRSIVLEEYKNFLDGTGN